MQQQFIPDEDRIPAEYRAGTTLPKPQTGSRSAKSCLLVTSMVFGLLFVVCAGVAMYQLHESLSRVNRVVDTLESAEPDAKEIRAIANDVRELASNVFFFGSADGLIPGFVVNIFDTDFAQVASFTNTLSTQLFNAFRAHSVSKVCSDYVTCPNGNMNMNCPDKSTRWCSYTGQRVNCAPDSACVASSVVSISSIIRSVSVKLQGWKRLVSAKSTAAFSSGLFRLDELFAWAEKQMHAGDWTKLGSVCGLFTFQVKSIDWTIDYVQTDGVTPASYNANRGVTAVMGYFDQVCQPLKQLSS